MKVIQTSAGTCLSTDSWTNHVSISSCCSDQNVSSIFAEPSNKTGWSAHQKTNCAEIKWGVQVWAISWSKACSPGTLHHLVTRKQSISRSILWKSKRTKYVCASAPFYLPKTCWSKLVVADDTIIRQTNLDCRPLCIGKLKNLRNCKIHVAKRKVLMPEASARIAMIFKQVQTQIAHLHLACQLLHLCPCDVAVRTQLGNTSDFNFVAVIQLGMQLKRTMQHRQSVAYMQYMPNSLRQKAQTCKRLAACSEHSAWTLLTVIHVDWSDCPTIQVWVQYFTHLVESKLHQPQL